MGFPLRSGAKIRLKINERSFLLSQQFHELPIVFRTVNIQLAH